MSLFIQDFLPGKPFGDAFHGNRTITTDTAGTGAATTTCSGSSGSKTLTLTAASTFANGDLVFIKQDTGTGVGLCELNYIVSGVGTTTLALLSNLVNTFTLSGASSASITELKRYRNATVNSSKSWTGNMVIAAKETATITGFISANGAGFGPGSTSSSTQTNGYQGYGEAGTAPVQSINANSSGGGGGDGSTSEDDVPGGGGGGSFVAGTTGQKTNNDPAGIGGAKSQTTADLTKIVPGGGGGQSGGGLLGVTKTGGTGGGYLVIFAKNLIVTGGITANGTDGQVGNETHDGGGGGGGGGCILLTCQDATLGTNLVTATAGAGGLAKMDGGAGGAGAIRLNYSGTYTGTTNPTLSTSTVLLPWTGRIGIIG